MRDWLSEAKAVDAGVYAAVAASETPLLDDGMRRLSSAADQSKLWFAAAATIALLGGPTGRGAAQPALSAPLRALATLVGYSRVHTGVHYPADVLAGAFIGVSAAELAGRLLRSCAAGR